MFWRFWKKKLNNKLGVGQKPTILAIVGRYWPGFKEVNFQPGDPSWAMLNRKASDWIWNSLPDDMKAYIKHRRDCENRSRKRLDQIDELLNEYTDILRPSSIFEIRGYVGGQEKPHSMLLECFGDGTARLREPKNKGVKRTSYMKRPWLVYS